MNISRWKMGCLIILWAIVQAPALENILIVRPQGANFEETTEFSLVSDIITSRPSAMVLMGSEAIQLYTRIQQKWTDSLPFPPSSSLMAIRVDKAIEGLQRATGIFYEVPGVTSFVNLRSVITDPILKVGVIVRPTMQDFVHENGCSKIA